MNTRYTSMTDQQLGETLNRLWVAKDAPRCANRDLVRQWWALAFTEFRGRQVSRPGTLAQRVQRLDAKASVQLASL